MSMPWTSYFKNGVPAPTLDSHNKEEGLCHIRLALGAVLGGAETNMMGNGQTVSPPLAEGGEHTAAPKKWSPSWATWVLQGLDCSPHFGSALEACDSRHVV